MKRMCMALVLAALAACGSGGGGGGSGGGGDAAEVSDMTAPADLASSRQFTDGGCLTFASASELCGSHSDGRVCDLAKSCGIDSDTGQCKINCEMGAQVGCYHPADADCLAAATTCDALAACHWIL